MEHAHSIKDLMELTAERLTGKRVVVQIVAGRYPTIGKRRINGSATKSLDGTPVICMYDAAYADRPMEGFKAFLHECAHVLLHGKDMPPRADYGERYDPVAAALATADAPMLRGTSNRQEQEADYLAEKWLKYAVAHVRPFERENVGLLMHALFTTPRSEAWLQN